ncbi:MAG TPA: glycoside hydrolase family 31 protein [Chitinophagaceae bacterium]|nr:glycoside hydrolase family 31 protein [Chitinophagaceae bacterium]
MQQETLGHNKYSIKYYPDAIEKVESSGNYFHFYTSKTILEVRVISDRIVRFRYAPDGSFQRDFSYAIRPDMQERLKALELKEEEEQYVIVTEKVKVFVNKENLRLKITNLQGEIINEDDPGFHWQYYIQKGGKIVYNSKKIQEGEAFFGLGDKPAELDLRHKRFENFGRDSYGFQLDEDPIYKNIPFYYGLHHNQAYGIFFDNTFRTLFDFGQEKADTASFWARGGEMNFYFIYGPQLMDVAEQYTQLTGTPDLPPMWALGYQQSRWSYFPESKVREIAGEFRKRKIPCDVLHLDIDYMDGFRCFTFDNERFPNPKQLTSDLEKDGFKTVAIIDPGIKVDEDYWVYKQGVENDYFCKRADGARLNGDVWPGQCVFPDFTNPKVRTWWKDLFKVIADAGISAVWNDMNEPAVFELGTFPSDVRHDYDGMPCSHRKAHNVYGHLMSKATKEGLQKHLMPKRTFVITRSCYAGAQRWSSVWTGDNIASWQHLWLASVMCQRLSISGLSFAGSDIGGFIDEPDAELYTRWIQLGVFNTFMRTHSAGNDTGFDQEPWSFGDESEKIVRQFIELRYKLLPYHYTAFWQNHKKGTPVLRPLSFVSQEDSQTWYRNEEFLFGDHLLVSAVVEPGQEEKRVYLPKGSWYYYFTDEIFEGGQEITIATPMDEMPLFVRAGAVIPQYPVMQYVGEKEVKKMKLHIYYGGGEVISELYEDAGDQYGYRNGEFNIIRFKMVSGEHRIQLKRRFIHHLEMDYDQYEIIVHGFPTKKMKVVVDGKKTTEKPQKVDKNKVFKLDKDFEIVEMRG